MSGFPRGPWDSGWKIQEELGKGGHGQTFRVVRRANSSEAALKILLKPKDPERRQRMYQETATLEALSHQGFPRLIETNASKHRDAAVKLYAVLEFIAGPTLSQLIEERGALSLEQGLALFHSLLELVRYLHSRNILHRDIKPDNLILRGGSPETPVLVDFGQTFNAELPGDGATYTGQQMGNRFFNLPELMAGSNKRGPYSDIAQACAVFFYVITGLVPSFPSDGSLMPHQRPDAVAKLRSIERGPPLADFFDRAFQLSPAARYPDVKAALLALSLVEAGHDDYDASLLRRVCGAESLLQQNPHFVAAASFRELATSLARHVKAGAKLAHSKFTQVQTYTKPESLAIDERALHANVQTGLGVVADPTCDGSMSVELCVRGDQFVISVADHRGLTDVLTLPVTSKEVPASFVAIVERIVLETLLWRIEETHGAG